MTEIYVIRHVQAEGNLYQCMQGSWDGDVTALGAVQRERLAERFRSVPVDAVYASDLFRARFTAGAVSGPHGLPLRLDRRLREMDVGPWEARPFANIMREQPEMFQAFLTDPERFSLPGAETYALVQKRTLEALREITAANPGRCVVIASHGIAIRCMLTGLLGVPVNDMEAVPLFGNTGVAHLRHDGGRFELLSVNDLSHLPEGERSGFRPGVSLRCQAVDPAAYRELYIRYYADAWQAAHGNLCCFDGETYYRAALAHHRADPEAVQLFFDGDEPVGLLDLDPARGRWAGYGWISLLYLCPAYRGQGLGVQLLGRAAMFYQGRGRKSLRLHVSEDNERALRFYRKWEFEELSWTDGTLARLWLMEKKLRRADHGAV